MMEQNFSIRLLRTLVLTLVIMGMLAAVAQAAKPNLIAAFFVKGKVGLKWQKIEGVQEFTIYRKGDGDFEKIASTDTDHYFDEAVIPGSTYIYKIAIVDGGDEIFSGEKTVTIPGDIGGFKAPNWAGVRLEGDKILLRWDPVPGAVAYNVWRTTTPGAGYEVVGNAQGNRYADRGGLEKGQTYHYVLSALNAEFEETEQSEERSIKFGVSLEEQQAILAEQNKIELEPVSLTLVQTITSAGDFGTMNQPADVVVNSQGQVYVSDALNSVIHCFDAAGNHQFSFGEKTSTNEDRDYPDGSFILPFTLALDREDRLFVSDLKRNDIQVFDASGKFQRRIRVAVGEGKEELRANGLQVLDDGRLLMSDAGNHRFLITSRSGEILLAGGERGNGPGQFNFPDGIAMTKDGVICVVDIINCRVQEFDMEGGFLRSFGEVGQSAGTFARPKTIAVDGNGRLWIADAMANMIQSFTVEGEVKSAIGTAEDPWTFVSPRGMFFTDGRFYVVNRLRHEVVVFTIG